MSGELIERLLATACFLANDDADLLAEAADALSTSEAARLKAEGELSAAYNEAFCIDDTPLDGDLVQIIAALGDVRNAEREGRLKAEARVKVLEEEQAWRPIETAPRDGTEVLLGAPAQQYEGRPTEPRVTVGHWSTDEECRVHVGDCGGECRCPEYDYVEPWWISWDGGFTVENPATHWRPLPEPPRQALLLEGEGDSASDTVRGDGSQQPVLAPAPLSAGGGEP